MPTKGQISGVDFFTVKKGVGSYFALSDGAILTEGPAIVQFIADSVPARALIPAAGTTDRYRALERLNFITSELHRAFSWFYRDEVFQNAAAKLISERFRFVETALSSNSYLMGDGSSVPDAYLFVMTAAAVGLKFDFQEWPNLAAFHRRILARPAVIAALRSEGLNPSMIADQRTQRMSRVAGELAKFM